MSKFLIEKEPPTVTIDQETGFQLGEQCPSCDTGGACRPFEADMITPPKLQPKLQPKSRDELVAELQLLRALVSRLKARAIICLPVASGMISTVLQEALNDHGGLPYEIHAEGGILKEVNAPTPRGLRLSGED